MRQGRVKLTKSVIERLKRGWHADSLMAGFGVMVRPTGVSFFVRYVPRGKAVRRFIPLGKLGVVTPDEARERARSILSRVAGGEDPYVTRTVPTWGDWVKTYFARLDVKVEGAYRRGDLFDKRAKMMSDWARFLTTPRPAGASVTPLRRKR